MEFRSFAGFLPFSRVSHSGPQFAFHIGFSQESVLEISLRHIGGARFTAEARHHRVLLDQPAEDGATDQGMSPAELLLASLGGCVGQYVAQYLRLRGLSCEGLLVRVATQPSPRTLHFGDFHVEVVAPGLNDRQLRALEKSFPAGLVQNAVRLENSLRITAVSEDDAAKP
jgi:putative redox protein